jgi:hypothetical protein
MYDNVSRLKLKHVRYLSLIVRGSECENICNEGNKMWYFYFHTKYLITVSVLITKNRRSKIWFSFETCEFYLRNRNRTKNKKLLRNK